MRILLHCVYYPPEVGGLESHVGELARGLVDEGHTVRVVTSRSRPEMAARDVVDGVEIARTWFPSRSPPGWIAHALASLPQTRRWAETSDIVHAQAFASIPPARSAARHAGIPLVSTIHTSHFLIRAEMRRWRPILRRLVEASDHTLAASVEIARVAGDLRRDGGGVEALTNGVDTQRFAPEAPVWRPPNDTTVAAATDSAAGEPARGPTRVLVVPRRLFEKNGVEYAIRALPLIRQDIPGACLLLVGDGPERPRLEALARELGVGEAAYFVGAQTHGSMPGWLCSGEIALFPSLMEATSVAALETMACGRPVIASDVGGLPEIIDEDVGALVPPANPPALAAAVVSLLQGADLPEMGRRARQRVEESWSNRRLVRRHLEIYEGLLGKRHSAQPDSGASA